MAKAATSGANLGFEGKLFLTADKLRGSMDASEYKHVALVDVHRRQDDQTLALVGVCVNRIGTVCSIGADVRQYPS